MVGCSYRVLPVLCLVLLQVAHARRLEERQAGWGGGLIRPTILPEPPTTAKTPGNDGRITPTLSTTAERQAGWGGGLIRPTILPEPPTTAKTPGNDGMITPTLPTTADSLKDKTAREHTIILNNRFREISQGLYEGDIVLTQEQKLLLQERKATNPALYWPKDSTGTVTVGYRFGDTIINKTLVKVALTHWETNTCVRFKEVSPTVGYAHLNFVDAGYCASYVGRVSTMTTGQTIWLYKTCVSEIGPAVHEIGHALGFNHEQSRSDRDSYVKVIMSNILAGKENNFNKEVTYNNGVPYDYWSVMHYGPDYFTSNGNNTLAAINPMAQPLMGNRIGLSFADKRLANIMYNCIGKWLTQCSLASDPCKNLGYTGPACSCVCPEGTSGSKCEVLLNPYTDALIKLKTPYSGTITTPGKVSTPGYPTPIQTRTKFAKVLVAPYCYKVKLTVRDFEVYNRYTDGTCAIDGLNIRIQDAQGTGVTYCGKEIAPGTVFISGNNTIVLDYYNYDYTTLTWRSPYRGFNATVEHILAAGCAVTINSGVIPLFLSTSSSGLCTLSSTSTSGSYKLTSSRYPSAYVAGDSCNVQLRTSEPRYITVNATAILTSTSEIIYLNSLFNLTSSITSQGTGQSYVLPSSSTSILFTPVASTAGKTFVLGLQVQNSNCHQIIKVDALATGILTKTSYTANTVCEWWIQAPSGRKIKLAFSAFNVGASGCAGDFLGIDTSGDPLYKLASKKYCATTSPISVTSSGGQMNVLLKGIKGGYPGFTAKYSVV